jgi:hypothetical protein
LRRYSDHELAARKLGIVIAAGNEPALRAARAVVRTLPIAFLAIDFDRVEKGYVASRTRPGGNITGIFVHPLELAAKRIELVRESLPRSCCAGRGFTRSCSIPSHLLLDLAVQSQDPGILLILAAPSTAQTFLGDENYDLLSSHSGSKLFRISVRIHPIFQMLSETDICQSRPRLAPSRRRRPISLTSDRLNEQQLYDYESIVSVSNLPQCRASH